MIDIKLLRENPDLVRENMRKKFKEDRLHLVDEALEFDRLFRADKTEADALRADRNKISKTIGMHMAKNEKDEAERAKEEVKKINARLEELEENEKTLAEKLRECMMSIPQIIGDEVPIGRDDSENVELEHIGEPVVPPYEIPYHVDIMEKLSGIDLDSARKTSGAGFYFLTGDIARLHSAILSYARDFMIDRGFLYCVPPFMRSEERSCRERV